MIIADLEVHSRYARACSKYINPTELNSWAKRKGVNILSTGDITHPLWRREIEHSLIEKEPGFFVLKQEQDNKAAPRFVLGGEVSLMFRQGEMKGRRVHLVFLAPSFQAVEKLVAKIQDKGQLASDGRPILGMSCEEFARTCEEVDPTIMIIPAHIWTPWFGLLGSKSGFDSIEDCFKSQSHRIKAYETGLSADTAMCWRVETLAKRVLISGSDLHSLPNMMREATLFNGMVVDYEYDRLHSALSEIGNRDYWGTIEFYPQEGKYHADGHASCKVVLEPEQTNKLNGQCPVCGGIITVGVNHRVNDLAIHENGYKLDFAGKVIYAIPLQEIIAEALGKSKSSKTTQDLYFKMTDDLGTEFAILHELKTFPSWIPARVEEGIQKVRRGEVDIHPGYDGLYGTIKLFEKDIQTLSLWEINI